MKISIEEVIKTRCEYGIIKLYKNSFHNFLRYILLNLKIQYRGKYHVWAPVFSLYTIYCKPYYGTKLIFMDKSFHKVCHFYWAFSWSWEHFLWSHSYCRDRISTYWGTTWSTVTTYLYVWIRRVVYKYVCICLSVYVYVWVFKKSILCWNISKY